MFMAEVFFEISLKTTTIVCAQPEENLLNPTADHLPPEARPVPCVLNSIHSHGEN